VTMPSSHADDDAAEVTWPRRDVEAESFWKQCCRVCLATAPLSPTDNGAVESYW
jgi:hypothetical protein